MSVVSNGRNLEPLGGTVLGALLIRKLIFGPTIPGGVPVSSVSSSSSSLLRLIEACTRIWPFPIIPKRLCLILATKALSLRGERLNGLKDSWMIPRVRRGAPIFRPPPFGWRMEEFKSRQTIPS